MNDLRLLLQIDPTKKIISLEFKQITSLDAMIPLLSKFEQLETLSLHGNRLKNLPKDMSSLQSLAELDISNNLFTDMNEIVQCLKSLPRLKHLIINFKSQNQENMVKNELPGLQRLNRKAMSSSRFENALKTNRKIREQYKLTETEMENVGILYDYIRDIYRDSKYLVDKQLTTDFDRNVENIMSQISTKIKASKSQTENSCHVLSGKYALVDLCSVKMITYFYHFDQRIAKCLQSIHDHQADMFRNITNLLYAQIEKQRAQISKIKTRKQELYRAQIRRLKNYQEQAQKQLNQLQEQNKVLFQKLYRKTQINMMEQVVMSKIGNFGQEQQQTPPKSAKSQKSPYSPIRNTSQQNKQNSKTVIVKSKPKSLTLNQLKEILYEIYYSKQKNNQACIQSYQPLQTMEMHMYTYLNLKYGLKNMSIEWAMAIVNGIRRYGMEDAEVAMFGKILRNQIEQGFVENIKKLRNMILQSAKKFKGVMYEELSPQSSMTVHQCQETLLYMHLKRPQANQIIQRIATKITNNTLTYEQFEYGVIDYYIQVHERRLKRITNSFKQADTDEDGIIDYEGLDQMMNLLDPKLNSQAILNLVDNSGKGVITFSFLVQTMLKNSGEFGKCFDEPHNAEPNQAQ